MRYVLSIYAAMLLSVAGCYSDGADEAVESAVNQVADTASIERVAGLWLEAFDRGDAKALAELFTDDAIYAMGDGQLLRGRDRIRSAAAEWLAVPHDLISSGVLRSGDAGELGYIVTSYAVRWEPPQGESYEVEGYASGVLRRQPDGGWKIESLVINRKPTAP